MSASTGLGALRGPVLIVEDDVDIRESIALVLCDEGVTSLQASNGSEGIDALKRAAIMPAVIVLDLMMPVMDGWQFAAAVRERPEWHAIPIILLSAGEELEGIARTLGATAFVRKPVDLEKLLEIVARCATTS